MPRSSCGRRRPLRKHAYSNILKISPPKTESFQIKNSDIFHISAQNIDCGYSLEPPHRGGSNEYPQSMFLSRNNKNHVYPCKPQFYYIKVGFKGSELYRYVFVMSDQKARMHRLVSVFAGRTCAFSDFAAHFLFELFRDQHLNTIYLARIRNIQKII